MCLLVDYGLEGGSFLLEILRKLRDYPVYIEPLIV